MHKYIIHRENKPMWEKRMLKRIQIKIILTFSIVGIIAITAFGLITVNNLQELQNIATKIPENIRN